VVQSELLRIAGMPDAMLRHTYEEAGKNSAACAGMTQNGDTCLEDISCL
jgi:hypothetical protein